MHLPPNPLKPRSPSAKSKPLSTVLGTALAFFAVAVILAMLFGWRGEELLIAAAIIAAATVLLSAFLLYRQKSERQAVHQALENVEARVGGIVESAMDPIITV